MGQQPGSTQDAPTDTDDQRTNPGKPPDPGHAAAPSHGHGGAGTLAWLKHLGQHLVAELPFGLGLVAFLTACTVLLHSFPVALLQRMEHAFVSEVMPRALELNEPADGVQQRPRLGQDGEFRIQQIELSGEFRALALEEPAPDAATIQRLDGVRPLSRKAMAQLLTALAECLGSGDTCPSTLPDRTTRPRVLALDLDLAPLQACSGAAAEECDAVLEALNALRRHVHVVLIALKRPGQEDNDLVARFVRDSGCTRDDTTPTATRHGLYFASPLLFERSHQGPLKFPALRAHGEPAHWFPSLGTVTWMASQAPADPQQDEAARERQRTLTRLCEAAHESTQALELALGGGAAHEGTPDHDYRWRYLNWLAMEDEQALAFTPVGLPPADTHPQAGHCLPGPQRQACLDSVNDTLRKFGLSAGTLLLSVDAGGRNDKFSSPGLRAEPVSGATVHAIQALSMGRDFADSRGRGIAADLVMGALMMVVLALLKLAALEPLRERLPYLGALLGTAAVVIVTLVMSWLAVQVSARMMVAGYWFNPLFVLIGLALHALVEGWLPKGAQPPTAWDRYLLLAFLVLAIAGAAIAYILHH